MHGCLVAFLPLTSSNSSFLSLCGELAHQPPARTLFLTDFDVSNAYTNHSCQAQRSLHSMYSTRKKPFVRGRAGYSGQALRQLERYADVLEICGSLPLKIRITWRQVSLQTCAYIAPSLHGLGQLSLNSFLAFSCGSSDAIW